MPLYQVVERSGYGTDWSLVREEAAKTPTDRLKTAEQARGVAKTYLTSVNVDNALTADEKRKQFEAFMVTDDGILLGLLDGNDWYLEGVTTKLDPASGRKVQEKGPITDSNYYELEGKTEVAVREMPGT